MSVPFDLWGQRGWASMDVAGESHYTAAIKALFGSGLTTDGTETAATVQLLPEPLNKHDRHAVAVWATTGQVGYLPRGEAKRYAPVLMELIARGWTPQVSARIWAAQWSPAQGPSVSVRLELAEPHMIVPANREPQQAHALVPTGAAIQVTGEENHLDVLARWLRPEGECWVYATLHEKTEELARSSRTVLEVRIDAERVGQLTPRMSGELLAAVRHLSRQERIAAVRAIVKGNRIKTEVVLYAARAHELPDSWLAASEEEARPAVAASVPAAPVNRVPVVAAAPAAAPAASSVPVAVPVAASAPVAAVVPDSIDAAAPAVAAVPEHPSPVVVGGYRFNPPPNWPAPPPGWTPPAGWTPDPAWGPMPGGWQLWIEEVPQTVPVTPPARAIPTPLRLDPVHDAPVPAPYVPVSAHPAPVSAPQVPGAAQAATVSASHVPVSAQAAPVPAQRGPGDEDIPLFGARGKARELAAEVAALRAELDGLRAEMSRLGGYEIKELEEYRHRLRDEITDQSTRGAAQQAELRRRLDELRQQVVITEEKALLQEAGIYEYQHPLSDAVAYQEALAGLQEQIKAMAKPDGGAVLAAAGWEVNGSEARGRTMLRDYSKLMLRAYNAEADNLVRTMKPYKLQAAVERLGKVAATIARLGKTMEIRVSEEYHRLRVRELGLTADYQEKLAEEREREREEKARLREERRIQQEIERERARLEKERQHYANAMAALAANGDADGMAQLQQRLEQIDTAIQDVDYRAANVRAGYVYVISNIGAFGENMIKVGMTRRLEPMDRVRELGDASVPFAFDVHALFFSDDAVGIESQMHARLAHRRVNRVNQRREFFYATPAEAKQQLMELTGSLLHYDELPQALEYRQSLTQSRSV